MELPNSIEEEIKDAKESFPQIAIQTTTNSFLSASYERTLYTRIKFTLTFPDDYPNRPLIVDIANVRICKCIFICICICVHALVFAFEFEFEFVPVSVLAE